MAKRQRVGGRSAGRDFALGQPFDPAQWVHVDEAALPKDRREQFLKRKRAIELYAGGATDAMLRQETGLKRRNVYRLIANRCLQQADDGTVLGWRGALPFLRIKAYTVSNGMNAPTHNGIVVCQSGDVDQPLEPRGASTMKLTTVGIDLAKNVFQVHGIDEHGKVLVKKQLRRDQMAGFFVNLPPCLIGMEACASAHHWARKLQGFGHTVKLMAPQFVKPYVKTNKNDAADAEAICEAVGRPNMRFVPIKNVEQQAVLALHRVRQGFVKARTAQANQIRGLLGEFGLIVPQGIGHIATRVPELIEDADNPLPGSFRQLVQRLLDHLKELDRQVDEIEAQIQAWHRNSELSSRLAQVPGIGPITASALVASIGDAKNFDDGRQLAAWLGLVPRQHSSGGKSNLLGMSKRGDSYLRTLLIHGARSVIYRAGQKAEPCSWVNAVVQRRNKNIAAVALANKNARIVWALLAHDRCYEKGYRKAGVEAG